MIRATSSYHPGEDVTDPVVSAFLRGFADHMERNGFGRYHGPGPDFTLERPAFILTDAELAIAETQGQLAKLRHNRRRRI